jgi:HEAT repeat protein
MGVTAVPHILARMDAPDTVARLQADGVFSRAGWRGHPFAPGAAEQGRAMFAFQALGVAGADAVPHLRMMLEDPRLTQAAAVSLGWIGPASLPALTEAAQHRDPWVRLWGTLGLGWLNDGARPAAPMLRDALGREPDAQVCWAIAWTLQRVRPEWSVSPPALATSAPAPGAR